MFVDVRLKPRGGGLGTHDVQDYGVADKTRLVRLHPANVSHGPHDVILRAASLKIYDIASGGPAFPTQYSGLRVWDSAMVELCMVAESDAPTGVGGAWKVRKGGVDYAVYLVETSDPLATSVRIKTSAGVKAARIKT